MATTTFAVSNASSVFPVSTVVKAYPANAATIAPLTGQPPGVSLGEGTVSATGTLEISGLTEGVFFLLAAEVAGAWRYLHGYAQPSGEVTIIATAATGDFAITTAGKGLRVKEGANAKLGSATLAAGKVTVANTSVTTESRIFCSAKGAKGEHAGSLTVTAKVAGASFTVESSNAEDAREFDFFIVEPA